MYADMMGVYSASDATAIDHNLTELWTSTVASMNRTLFLWSDWIYDGSAHPSDRYVCCEIGNNTLSTCRSPNSLSRPVDLYPYAFHLFTIPSLQLEDAREMDMLSDAATVEVVWAVEPSFLEEVLCDELDAFCTERV